MERMRGGKDSLRVVLGRSPQRKAKGCRIDRRRKRTSGSVRVLDQMMEGHKGS
jgi:hypothetical protein